MVDFKKLKTAMDADGDFMIDRIISPDDQDPYEEILMIRTGAEGDSEYRISIEKHISIFIISKVTISIIICCYLKPIGSTSSNSCSC